MIHKWKFGQYKVEINFTKILDRFLDKNLLNDKSREIESKKNGGASLQQNELKMERPPLHRGILALQQLRRLNNLKHAFRY